MFIQDLAPVVSISEEKLKKYGKREEVISGRESQAVLNDLELSNYGSWPRNKTAYKIIQESFPDFSWEEHISEDGRRYVVFINPPSYRSSLAEMTLEAIRRIFQASGFCSGFSQRIEIESFTPRVKDKVEPLILRGEQGLEFAKLITSLPISLPSIEVMEAVGNWFERALSGEKCTILSPVCPDYATRETNDQSCPRIYTFDGLGSGIGYVAQRALFVLPFLWEFFKEKKVDVEFVVAIADFEGDSDETCQRVGITREEFYSRLRKSQEAFKKACPSDMPVKTPFFTEINPDLWQESFSLAKKAVRAGDFGALCLNDEDIGIIAQSRISLYRRWYGDNVDAEEILLRQAPEYMAMGRVSDSLPGSMILGADAVSMAHFMQGLTDTARPVMYMKNINY